MDCESTYPETNVTGDWPPPLVSIPHLVTVNLMRVALRHGPYICRLSNVRMCPHSLTAQKKSRLADYIGKRYEKLSTYFICNRVPYFPFPFPPLDFGFLFFPFPFVHFPFVRFISIRIPPNRTMNANLVLLMSYYTTLEALFATMRYIN